MEGALLRHAYAWIADALPFEVVVDIDPVGTLGASDLAKRGELITVERSNADVKWGHLADGPGTDHTRVQGAPAATGLDSDRADLLVWAPAALRLPARWRQVLAEARRVVRPGGLVALVLDDANAAAAASAAHDLGFPNSLRIDHRPLIGSAIGSPGSASLGDEEPTGSGAILLLGAIDPPSFDFASSIALEHGDRGLKLEAAGHPTQPPPADELGQDGVSGPQPTPAAAEPAEDQVALLHRLAQSEDRCARAESDKASAVRTLATVEGRAAADRARAARLAMTVEEGRQHMEMVTSSPSWRLTGPLRRFKRLLRR